MLSISVCVTSISCISSSSKKSLIKIFPTIKSEFHNLWKLHSLHHFDWNQICWILHPMLSFSLFHLWFFSSPQIVPFLNLDSWIFSERLHKIIQEWSSTMCRHFMSDVYWFILEYDILFRHKVGKSKRLLENWNRIGKFLKTWFDTNIFLETLMSAVLQRLFLLLFYYRLSLLSCGPPLPGLGSDWGMQSQCCGSIPVCVLYTVSASTTLCLHSLMSVCRLN